MHYKIIIDSLALLGSLSGVGRYNYEIAKHLLTNKNIKIDFYYGYTSTKLIDNKAQPGLKSLRRFLIQNPFIKSISRKFMNLFAYFFTPMYDIYWQPNFIANHYIKARKIIITVHDFSWEIYPDFQPKERIRYFQKNLYSSAQKAHHIITGSNFTKQEIISRLHIKPENITVIYHGINHTLFYPILSNREPLQHYILSVGSIEPRKNLKNLLLAYEMLDEPLRENYHLVLVGAAGWNNDEIMALMKKLERWVHYSGFVSDEKLASLYRDATLFVYPSLYEGFGIPPLEAMACGTAVLASNVASLPEACGDAAYYVNPTDVNAICDGIKILLKDESLRKQLCLKGLKRAQTFSWEKSAQAHQEVFEKVCFKS